MSITDYILNGLLVAVVIRQIRGRRLTTPQVLWPLLIVGYAVIHYLHGVPTAGNDLFLAVAGALAGTVLGTSCGLLTNFHRNDDGVLIAKATGIAAALWVLGVGARMGFSIYAEHGGGPSILRFSAAHSITTIEAWVAGLILMALCEVVSRTVVLVVRSGLFREWMSAATA